MLLFIWYPLTTVTIWQILGDTIFRYFPFNSYVPRFILEPYMVYPCFGDQCVGSTHVMLKLMVIQAISIHLCAGNNPLIFIMKNNAYPNGCCLLMSIQKCIIIRNTFNIPIQTPGKPKWDIFTETHICPGSTPTQITLWYCPWMRSSFYIHEGNFMSIKLAPALATSLHR